MPLRGWRRREHSEPGSATTGVRETIKVTELSKSLFLHLTHTESGPLRSPWGPWEKLEEIIKEARCAVCSAVQMLELQGLLLWEIRELCFAAGSTDVMSGMVVPIMTVCSLRVTGRVGLLGVCGPR